MTFRGFNILLADKKEKFWRLTSSLLGVFLFLGGLGVEPFYIKVYGVLISTLLVGLAWFWKVRIRFPQTSKWYGLFLAFFVISLFWSRDWKYSYEHFLLFLSGGFFWVAFYNLSSEYGRWLDKIVIVLGLIFGGLFILNHFWGEVRIRPWSLFLPYTGYLNHNNIGDFWAIILAIIIFYLIQKPKKVVYWLLGLLGIYFLYMSQSRSAYLALVAGTLYLSKKLGLIDKYKRIFIFLYL